DQFHDWLVSAAVDNHVRSRDTSVAGSRLGAGRGDALIRWFHHTRARAKPRRLCRRISVPPDRSYRRSPLELIEHAERLQVATEQYEAHAVERAGDRGLEKIGR